MEAKEVIERLCALQEKVSRRIGFNYAADCFCGMGGFWSNSPDYDGTMKNGYRNDGKSLEFIENAVSEKLGAVNSRLQMIEKELAVYYVYKQLQPFDSDEWIDRDYLSDIVFEYLVESNLLEHHPEKENFVRIKPAEI